MKLHRRETYTLYRINTSDVFRNNGHFLFYSYLSKVQVIDLSFFSNKFVFVLSTTLRVTCHNESKEF